MIEAAILAICAEEFKPITEIAKALDRSPRRLRDKYIAKLVKEGRLMRH